MPVKWLLLALLIAACSSIPQQRRIALLAPFEGRYREIGYEALYAARLALQDAGPINVELLPIDDGGTLASAAVRARALALDPQVQIALVLGLPATDSQTLADTSDIPVIVVGQWGVQPVAGHVFTLPDTRGDQIYNISTRADLLALAQVDGPLVAAELLSLPEFSALQPRLHEVQILSAAALPDEDFSERYRTSSPFAPEPRLYATATYDAMNLALNALATATDREALAAYLNSNYPTEVPTYTYRFDPDAKLVPVDAVIEER